MISARRPASLVIVVLAFAGILSFMYIKVAPWGLRHQGHLFFAFLFADWISRRGAAWPPRWRHLADRISSRRADWFLGGLLVVQAGAGLFAAMRDVQMPFSAGRETAQFIQQNYPPDVPIVGDMDAAASTVAGYLDRSIYYVAGHREGTFIVWDKKRYADEVDPDGRPERSLCPGAAHRRRAVERCRDRIQPDSGQIYVSGAGPGSAAGAEH
jgi:hypothetical protein